MKSPVARRTTALALTLLALGSGGCGQRRGEVAELMEALGPRRPVEPRLTGELAYAPCRPARAVEGRVPDALCSALPRPGSAHWRALEKVGKRINRQHRPTPQRLQAQGLERLLWRRQEGAADMAVEKLRQASSLAPKDAHLWSDLAAALYVQAQQEGEPRDLLFALSAAGTAVDLAPALPEALFNRALLLDRLYLRSEATAGWKRYLEVDSRSPWAGEARAHLTALQAPSVPELWKRQLPTLRAAATTGDEKMLAALVATSPQTAREYAVEEVLGQWGSDILAGKGSEAAVELRVAGGIGRALVARGGDGTVAQAVAVIERAGGEPVRLACLARGHRAYHQGSVPFKNLNIEAAAAPMREARDALGSAGSIMAYWADATLAGVDLYGSRYEKAAETLTAITQRVAPTSYPALAGRVRWGLGLTRLRQGRLSESLVAYRAALDGFLQAGESENLGTIHAWIAEVLQLLGDNENAWQKRYAGLGLLSRFPDSLRLHTLLWESADAAGEVVGPELALVFQEEGVEVARRLGNPLMIAEALLRRSKLQVAAGAVDAAFSDLQNSSQNLEISPAGEIRDKLQSDIALFRGQVERDRNPRQAMALLDEAIRYYRPKGRLINLAVAHLTRARAAIDAGLDGAAEGDLDAAIQIFEQQRSRVTDNRLRLSYSDAVQEVFDERILLAARRSPAEEALGFAERARTVPLERLEIPATPADGAAPAGIPAVQRDGKAIRGRLSRLPANVVFVEYAWIHDRLLRWTVRREGVEIDPDTRLPSDLEARIGEWDRARSSGSEERLQNTLSTLGRDLLPRAVLDLPSGSQVFFVPDKDLNRVPFAALRNPRTGRYMIEEHPAVGVVPSISFYLDAAERPGSGGPRVWNALLVGNPALDSTVYQGLGDLSQASAEIDDMAAIYPGAQMLRGTDATKAAFLARLDRQEILEYAGHSIDNPKHPAYSQLVLAPSKDPPSPGALYAHEIAGLHLKKLRFVVLNACQTIAARNLRVGGLSGMARPFLDAGAQAVLGTMWKVDDRPARRLLVDFHRRFRATGAAAASLREAQLAFLRSPDPGIHSPRSWAAFQMVGAIPPA